MGPVTEMKLAAVMKTIRKGTVPGLDGQILWGHNWTWIYQTQLGGQQAPLAESPAQFMGKREDHPISHI